MQIQLINLISSATLVLLIILWPVKYPVVTVEVDDGAEDYIVLTSATPLTQELPSSYKKLAGFSFWPVSGQAAAVLTLTVRDGETVLTEQSAAINDLATSRAGARVFTFSSVKPSVPNQPLQVILQIHEDDTLEIKRAQQNMVPDGSTMTFAQQHFSTGALLPTTLKLTSAHKTEGEDIWHHWRRGGELASGQNVYLCAKEGSCLDNKIPIHFPLFYWLSAATHQVGLTEFDAWMGFWRPIFLLAYGAIGVLLAWPFARRRWLAAAAAVLLFWLVNRWSLYVIRVAHIDFLALLPLVASVLAWRKQPKLSLVLLGFSLALKQMAIFLVPVYLALVWHRNPQRRPQQVLVAALLIAVVPLVTILPFVADLDAFVEAVFFSVTRDSEANFGAPSVDAILGLTGSVTRLVMITLMLLVAWSSWRRGFPLAPASLLIFIIFLTFNAVVFNQYFIWPLAFVPLAVASAIDSR